MTATEILIRDRDDLRPGDVVRVWPHGGHDRWCEGPICVGHTGDWLVGGRFLRRNDGQWEADFDLAAHPARRPVPPVDEAQVEALTDLILAITSGSRMFHSTLARRLLETGRIEVKP